MAIKSNTLKMFKNVFNKKYLEIEGGESLKGNIKISGAKNSALVLMAASIFLVKLIFLMFLKFLMYLLCLKY